jgi:hypothetical protein
MAFALFSPACLFSQGKTEPVKFLKEYPAKSEIKMFSTSNFRLVYYVSANEINTYKDNPVVTLKGVEKLVMNPTGNSIAMIQDGRVKIYSFLEKDNKLFDLEYKSDNKKIKRHPVALAFSNDATKLFVSLSDGVIAVCNTKDYQIDFVLQSGIGVSSALTMSDNGYFVAAIKEKQIDIWNFEKREIRAKLELDVVPTGIAFSNDDSQLAVTLPNQLLIYNTRTWEVAQSFPFDGLLSSPSFNNDDKFLSFLHDNTEIIVFNVPKKEIAQKISEPDTIRTCNFLRNTADSYIIANQPHAIILWNSKDLEPFYTKIINLEVNKKMNEWVKKGDVESANDYKERVNNETRGAQQELFRQELTTALALKVLVPANPDPEDIYYLNEGDEFILADKIEPLPVEEPDDFVPLDILQIASQAESNLRAATEAVIAQSKLDNLITDKTEIQVATEVLPDVDVDGNKILNYKVNYKYATFEGKEDFPPGSYELNKSNAAMSLLKIIKITLEGEDFVQYLAAGNRVKIKIIGSADGASIRGKIAYDGRYGDFEREPYYQNEELNSMTLTKATGITTNEQLAYARTASVRDWLSNNVSTLKDTYNDYQSQIEVSEEQGSEFRRVEIQFTIIDAFK